MQLSGTEIIEVAKFAAGGGLAVLIVLAGLFVIIRHVVPGISSAVQIKTKAEIERERRIDDQLAADRQYERDMYRQTITDIIASHERVNNRMIQELQEITTAMQALEATQRRMNDRLRHIEEAQERRRGEFKT